MKDYKGAQYWRPNIPEAKKTQGVSLRPAVAFLLRYLLLSCAGQEANQRKATKWKGGDYGSFTSLGRPKLRFSPTKEEAPQETAQSLCGSFWKVRLRSRPNVIVFRRE